MLGTQVRPRGTADITVLSAARGLLATSSMQKVLAFCLLLLNQKYRDPALEPPAFTLLAACVPHSALGSVLQPLLMINEDFQQHFLSIVSSLLPLESKRWPDAGL